MKLSQEREDGRLKILVFCRGVGSINRGAERSSMDLAQHLREKHEVQIVSWGQDNSNYRVKRWIDFEFINSFPRILLRVIEHASLDAINLDAISFTLGSGSLISKSAPDAIISTGGPWEISLLRLLRLSLRLKFKIVSVGQGGLAVENKQLRARPDAHVTLSRFSENILFESLRPGTILKKIPNMINFKPQTRRDRPANESVTPVVLVVAAAVDYKNVDLTMQAVAKAGFKLVWCGDGPLRQQLLEIANRLYEPNRFSWITARLEDMPLVYSSADIFTLASRRNVEAFGNVYLEAMSSGLRVVATDDEIRREVCGSAGRYVNPNDIEGYATALINAWGDTLAHGALDWEAGEFSPGAVTSAFSQVLHEVCEP